MKRMPDFIIIGAMKCATSTLHLQLARQAGIFMSTPKEPCFFSDDEQFARGLDWYRNLFADAAPEDLCGESSTHYTKLPTYPRTIERLRAHLPPHTRFIYIMRHPVDRLISHYMHEWTQRLIDCPIDSALDRHPELIAYSRYAMQLESFINEFGRERVLPMFFERVSSHPQEELERVCEFLNYHAAAHWDDSVKDNVSAERLRASRLRDAVVNAPGLRQLRRALVPKSVREYVKGFWTMKRRPQLSPHRRQRLEAIFDEDLAKLGSWLGLTDLRCATYKDIGQQTAAQWRESAAPAQVNAA